MNTALKGKLYNITFTLHDLTHKPIPYLYFEIKNGKELVKKGRTNLQGEISLKYVGGNSLTVFVRKDHDQTMKKIGVIHTPNKNIRVKLISPKMKFDVTLLPHKEQGKYWRGTYQVKSGDTLSKIAKEHNTTVSALLALNPSIKSPNSIYKDEQIALGECNADAVIKLASDSTIKIPPSKKKGKVIDDRKSESLSSADIKADIAESKTEKAQKIETKSHQVQSSKQNASAPQTAQLPAQNPSQQITSQTAAQQKIDVQQEHNDKKQPVAVAGLSGCVCKDYSIAWGKSGKYVNCEFRKKVIQICKDMWPNDIKNMANNLMACMHLESNRSFNPAIENDAGYVGLIQFGKDVIADLKKNTDSTLTKEKLRKMSGVQQLDLVKAHFMWADHHKLMKSLTDMYLYINYPNALLLGKNKPSNILYQGGKGTSAYHANPSFMKENGEFEYIYDYKKNSDGSFKLDKSKNKIPIRGFDEGKTYIWEVTKEIEKHFAEGIKEKNKETNFSCSIKPAVSTKDICANCHKKHMNLKDSVKWISQFSQPRPNVACARTCVLILKNSKLSPSAGSSTGLFQVAIENSKHTAVNATDSFQSGLNYLDKELASGHPVMIGVDHKLGYGFNEGMTDHFIVVVGRGCENGKIYYNFYDVGTRHQDKGASEDNKLYVTDGFLRGRTAYNGSTYTMTQVRRN